MKTKIQSLFILLACLAGVDQIAAQSAVFTYQGRVTDNGTNFTGTGQFEFALVTSTNTSTRATATAIMGGIMPHEFVIGFNLAFGGSGYVTPPGVTITGGGGSGASAQATISGGAVNGISIINPGSSYTGAPTVMIDPPPPNIVYVTYWSNDGTSSAGSEPAAAVAVAVTNGLFTVVLGDTNQANMTAIAASLFTQPNLQLRIWFNDGTAGFAALSPLQNLTPTPYAITAGMADALNGTLPASQLSGSFPVQLSGKVPLAQLPAAVVTNSETAVQLSGTFSGDGSALSGVAKSYITGGPVSGSLGPAATNYFAGPGNITLSLAAGQTVLVSASAGLGTTATSLFFTFCPAYALNGGPVNFMAGVNYILPIATAAGGRQIYSETLSMTIPTTGTYVFGCGIYNGTTTNLNNNDYENISVLVFK
jgi:hypothetical protein